MILESIIWTNGNNFEKEGFSLYSGSADKVTFNDSSSSLL